MKMARDCITFENRNQLILLWVRCLFNCFVEIDDEVGKSLAVTLRGVNQMWTRYDESQEPMQTSMVWA